MADEKITALNDLAAADMQGDDLLVAVDVHDTTMAPTGTDKKALISDFLAAALTLGLIVDDTTHTWKIKLDPGGPLRINVTDDATGNVFAELQIDPTSTGALIVGQVGNGTQAANFQASVDTVGPTGRASMAGNDGTNSASLTADGTVGNQSNSRDLTFDTAGTGPVVPDQSDGHTYRIVTTAGVLGVQLVT